MTDYGAGDPPKLPEPDESDATIGDSECPSAITGKSPVVLPTRDARFYISSVVFKVGNTIFQVPRNGFKVPGTVFEAMFSLPTGTDDLCGVQGTSDENPIILPVDEDDFRGFLGALYSFLNPNMTSYDWLGALKLATVWMFDGIRNQAINKLDDYVSSKGAKDAVLLAKKYRVESWLKAAYIRMLQAPLKIEELLQTPSLDWETIARISYAKQLELTFDHASCLPNARPHNWGGHESTTQINSVIEQSFRMELDNIKWISSANPALSPLPEPPLPASSPSAKKKKKKASPVAFQVPETMDAEEAFSNVRAT